MMQFLYISFFLFSYYVYVCTWFYFFLDWSTFFSHFPYVYVYFHFFLFEHIAFFFQVTIVLSIVNPNALPFQKVCENYHVIDVIICPMGVVYCNACHSKWIVQKLSFLRSSIATNDEPMLLTIESKWLETIVHMTKSEFLDLPSIKQVQFFISIYIHGKFPLSTTSTLVGFQEDIQ